MLSASPNDTIPLGIGYYTVPEAARLLRIRALSVRRWLGGYTYMRQGQTKTMAPLWTPQLPANDDHIELSFRDLIELRFVAAFIAQGLSLQTIRACLDTARELVVSEHPFSTRRFKTDGRRIFVETFDRAKDADKKALLDLKDRQYVLVGIVERTFRDLDFDDDMIARWRPFSGKTSIVVDPTRAFGQPIVANGSVPTVALAGAAAAEGSEKRVAFLYDVPLASVRDAVAFERGLAAA